jgi:hypothetical protein
MLETRREDRAQMTTGLSRALKCLKALVMGLIARLRRVIFIKPPFLPNYMAVFQLELEISTY